MLVSLPLRSVQKIRHRSLMYCKGQKLLFNDIQKIDADSLIV